MCHIRPKMLWMHYVVSISHFAKYGTNRPLIVRECEQMSKNPLFHNGKENESDPESTHGSTSPPKVNHFSCPCLPSLVDVRFCVRQLSCLQNDRQNDHITSTSLAEVIQIESLLNLPRSSWELRKQEERLQSIYYIIGRVSFSSVWKLVVLHPTAENKR